MTELAHDWVERITIDVDEVFSIKSAIDGALEGFENDNDAALNKRALLFVANDTADDDLKTWTTAFRATGEGSKTSFSDLRVVSFNASRAAASRLRSLATEVDASCHVHEDAQLALSDVGGDAKVDEDASNTNEEVFLIWEEVQVSCLFDPHSVVQN